MRIAAMEREDNANVAKAQFESRQAEREREAEERTAKPKQAKGEEGAPEGGQGCEKGRGHERTGVLDDAGPGPGRRRRRTTTTRRTISSRSWTEEP